MKKLFACMAAALMLTLSACGGGNGSAELAALENEINGLRERIAVLETQVAELKGSDAPSVPELTPSAGTAALTEEQQRIADAVSGILRSEEFALWQQNYKEMHGKPRAAEVSGAVRYQIGDFEGEKMDCWLVSVSADVGIWMSDGGGMALSNFQIFVDAQTGAVYDLISADAGNFDGDVSDDEGKAVYLLWNYMNDVNDPFEGPYLNSSEIITELPEADIDAVNDYLGL